MRLRHRGALAVLSAIVVTLIATSAFAAPSGSKPGCPAITRAQAEAAIGDVGKIEHNAAHTAGPFGGTWLVQCRIHFGPGFKKAHPTNSGGSLVIFFDTDDRKMFNGRRPFYLRVGGRAETVRGLGTPAFRYTRHEDPTSPEWELYVFHPGLSRQYTYKDPVTKGPLPPYGSFSITSNEAYFVRFQSLVAIARAVLKFPKR